MKEMQSKQLFASQELIISVQNRHLNDIFCLINDILSCRIEDTTFFCITHPGPDDYKLRLIFEKMQFTRSASGISKNDSVRNRPVLV